MALPATDAFTNSNGTSLVSHSASWTQNTGAAYIQSNALASNTSGNEMGAHWNADTFDADQYSQGTLVATSSNVFIGPAVRVAASASTYYGYYLDNNETYMFKMVSGSWTQIGGSGSGSSGGISLRLEVSGTTLTPIRAGSTDSSVGAQTDSSIASGSAGVTGYGNSVSTRFDDWEGGNLGGGSDVNVSGSSAATSSTTALAEVDRERSGQSDAALITSGTAEVDRERSGQSDAVLTTSADAARDRAISGQSDAALTTSASADRDRNRSGQSDAVLTTSATTERDRERSGQSDAVLATSAVANVDRERSGQSNTVLSTSANATVEGQVLVSGQSDALLVTVAVANVDRERSGQSDAVLSTFASATTTSDTLVSGQSDSVLVTSAAIEVDRERSGQSDSVLITVAITNVDRERSGQADSLLSTSADAIIEAGGELLVSGQADAVLSTSATSGVERLRSGVVSAVLTTSAHPGLSSGLCNIPDALADISSVAPYANSDDLREALDQLRTCCLGYIPASIDPVATPLQATNAGFEGGLVDDCACDVLYLLRDDGILFVSADFGRHWAPFASNGYRIFGKLLNYGDPNEGDSAFIYTGKCLSYDPCLAYDSLGNIWYSEDRGATWLHTKVSPTFVLVEAGAGVMPQCVDGVATIIKNASVSDGEATWYDEITGELEVPFDGLYFVHHYILFDPGEISSSGALISKLLVNDSEVSSLKDIRRGVGGSTYPTSAHGNQEILLNAGDIIKHEVTLVGSTFTPDREVLHIDLMRRV